MKFFKLCPLAFSILFSSALFAADPPKDQAQVAAYFDAIMAGDVEKANALITVPFSLDRKSILKTKDEVDAVHKKIAEQKGKRPVPNTQSQKLTKRQSSMPLFFPSTWHFAWSLTTRSTSTSMFRPVSRPKWLASATDHITTRCTGAAGSVDF